MNRKFVAAFFLAATLAASCPIFSFGQVSKFMSVDELRPGMKGVGRTVFQGTTIEDFQVEIIGVLKNFAPKQDMVLARLAGGPLEKTGVIQGMSGSPVYIDGRLVGAVAFAFPYSKEPLAGIQPIAQMLNILDLQGPALKVAEAPGLPSVSPAAFVYGMLQQAREGKALSDILGSSVLPMMANAGSIAHIMTPLSISGATPGVMQQFSSFFNTSSFSPVQSGGAGSGANLGTLPGRRLEPGSAVDAELVRGDIGISANGTVTYVDGDKVYAFGHPFLSVGPVSLPMSNAYVVSLLPKLDTSSKIAVPLDVIGSFHQDRSTGILGSMGDVPNTIPVTLTVKSSLNSTNRYNFEVANDRYLTPLLMNFAVINGITASERGVGALTLSVSGTVHMKDNDSVNISNIFTGDQNGPSLASLATVSPIQYLMTSGYDGAVIQRVDLEVVATDRKISATLERISIDRNEVHPGDTVMLSAYLRGTSGEMAVERYPVQIPAGLSGGTIQLQVSDGNTATSGELRRGAGIVPPDLKTAIQELNKLRRADRLYIKVLSNEPGIVIGGEELPSLPPSMIAVLGTNRASSRGVTATGGSTIGEFELPASNYVIQGQRTLTLTVKP